MDGPLSGTGDTVTYSYNSSGYLATITNQVGQVTTISAWDGRGQPMTVVDPNSVTTTFTYDIRGRPLTVTIDPGAAQSQYAFEYNAVGDVTKVTLPLGGFLTYTYDDARRLTQMANDRGQTQTFTNNLMGEATAVTVKTSGAVITAQQSAAFDELGRLIQQIGAGSQTWNFGYDKVDNPTSTTDARGKLWQTTFVIESASTPTTGLSTASATASRTSSSASSTTAASRLATTRTELTNGPLLSHKRTNHELTLRAGWPSAPI